MKPTNTSAHRYAAGARKHSTTHGVARNSSRAHLTHDRVSA